MNPLLKDLHEELSVDPLWEAEKVTGHSYNEHKGTEALGFLMHIEKNRRTRELMEFTCDSHFGTTLAEYIAIVERIGFQKVLERDFFGVSCCEHKTCKQFVFWHERGALLHFDTYSEGVNSGNVYFNWIPNGEIRWPSVGCSGGFDDNGVMVAGFDCREAVKLHFEMMEAEGAFLPKWKKRPFLWLLTWADTKDESGKDKKQYDHKAITDSVIAMLPSQVQSALAAP